MRALLRMFMTAMLLLAVAGCGKGSQAVQPAAGVDPPPPPPPSGSEPRMVLRNIGVTIAPYDSETGRAGDFLFLRGLPKPLGEFGQIAYTPDHQPKALPHFTYAVAESTHVLAAISGRVLWAELQQPMGDYEVLIAPSAGSKWWVSYDHVHMLRFAPGDSVRSGDVIANAWPQGGGQAWFEFMVGHDPTGSAHYAYCPWVLFDSASRDAARAQVAQLAREWEAFKGDESAYDESAWTCEACLADSLDN